MTKDDLPPLPNPGIREWVGNEDEGETIEGFTHHQMREYACVARSDLLDALERARHHLRFFLPEQRAHFAIDEIDAVLHAGEPA